MSPITDFPSVTYIGDGRWKLDHELTYPSRYGKIVVPSGFESDMDSIPRLPFAYLLTKNASVVGAIVHDWLYKEGWVGDYQLTREQADDIMFDVMVDEGVSWWQRRMIRVGLRIAGWYAWNKHRNFDDGEDPDFV